MRAIALIMPYGPVTNFGMGGLMARPAAAQGAQAPQAINTGRRPGMISDAEQDRLSALLERGLISKEQYIDATRMYQPLAGEDAIEWEGALRPRRTPQVERRH
jgi:hypothetical protein